MNADIQIFFTEYEETGSQNNTDEIQEAISWYNMVLGFYIEGGHGNWSLYHAAFVFSLLCVV